MEADSLHSNAPGGAAGLFLGRDSSGLAHTARQHGARLRVEKVLLNHVGFCVLQDFCCMEEDAFY